MQLVCHVLPYEVADGPANMALDDVLLDEAAAEPGAAFLRVRLDRANLEPRLLSTHLRGAGPVAL